MKSYFIWVTYWTYLSIDFQALKGNKSKNKKSYNKTSAQNIYKYIFTILLTLVFSSSEKLAKFSYIFPCSKIFIEAWHRTLSFT